MLLLDPDVERHVSQLPTPSQPQRPAARPRVRRDWAAGARSLSHHHLALAAVRRLQGHRRLSSHPRAPIKEREAALGFIPAEGEYNPVVLHCPKILGGQYSRFPVSKDNISMSDDLRHSECAE